jgi:hypothetical protein
MNETKKRIILDTSEKVFYYQGYIISDEGEFLTFKDDRAGVLKLNKCKIISIQEISDIKKDFRVGCIR